MAVETLKDALPETVEKDSVEKIQESRKPVFPSIAQLGRKSSFLTRIFSAAT